MNLWKPIALIGVLPIILAGCGGTLPPIAEIGFDGYELPNFVHDACDYLAEEFPGEECVTE